MTVGIRHITPLAAAMLLFACDGAQSVFGGAGVEASRVALLSWVMIVAGGVILAIVCGAVFVAIWGSQNWKNFLRDERIIIYGGVAFPAVVLTALLFYGFSMLRAGEGIALQDNPVRVSIVGEQWWWRVIYETADGGSVETANELRIPVGRTVAIELTSADVIHSFWIPAYAGKLDMIPGRTNTLHIKAKKPGLVRGQCAEYCGGAHALMSFFVEALSEAEFTAWMVREQASAQSTDDAGAQLFNAAGCGGCHAIRGTKAVGVIGPDLTHVASRHSLAAATLANDEDTFRNWLRAHQSIKPQNRMPSFDFLSNEEVSVLAAYLGSLD